MRDLLTSLLDSSGFTPGRHQGGWSSELIWLHISADLMIWLAFLAIAMTLVYFIRRRPRTPFPWMFWMFGLFIVSCGFTHFMNVVTFEDPVYRLSALIKIITALASWATVLALIPLIPKALSLRSPADLEREIAERKRVEESLRQSEERFRLLVEGVSDYAIFWLAPDGRVVNWNKGAQRILGYSAEEIVGHHFACFYPPEDLEHGKPEHLRKDAATEGRKEDEGWRVRKDQSRFWAHVVITALRDASGQLLGFAKVTRDLTGRKQTEEKFRGLLDSAPDAMLIVQKDGRIVQVNTQTEQMFGYRREELLGKPAEILVPERFRSKHPKQRSGYFVRPGIQPDAKTNGQELYGLRKDASEFPVEISLSPLETETGTLVCSSIRDISERKQAEVAIHQQSRILKCILDSIGDAVLVADESGQFLLFNPAAEELFRLGPSPTITDTWTKRYGLFAPDMITPYPTRELPLVRAMRGESVDGAEVYVRHAAVSDGIWTSANARPLKDEQGTVRGGVVVFRNITERKQAEEQLTAFALQLKRSNRELQEFASVASHDLQEPLRKIQAFGDRLQAKLSTGLDSQARDYLERMLTAASRMRSLIDDLLTFSRVTTKAQPFLPVDLNLIAHEVLSDLESRLHQTGGKVEVAELPTIEADPLQMRQLFQNLMSNGLKFHRAEQAPLLKIQARILPPGTRVNHSASDVRFCEISVQDNGIGFDEKYLDRLFHVFQRLHGRSEYEGTGMGLAICRRITERHGGAITAKSAPGKGATFFVTLPLKHTPGGKSP